MAWVGWVGGWCVAWPSRAAAERPATPWHCLHTTPSVARSFHAEHSCESVHQRQEQVATYTPAWVASGSTHAPRLPRGEHWG